MQLQQKAQLLRKIVRNVALLATLALARLSAAQGESDPVYLLNHGRVDEARQFLLNVLRSEPNHPHANALLGQIAFDAKDYNNAVAYFAKGEQVVAQSPRVTLNYADALLRTANPDVAERLLAKLPAADAEAHFRAGLLLAGSERYAAAEQHFLAAGPHYRAADVLAYNLALTQYNARKFRECSLTLEEARQKGLRDGDILNLSGLCYLDGGEPKKALDTFQQAIGQAPSDERNYVGISRLAIEEDQPLTGLEFVNKGLKLLPKSYTLLLQRGYLNLSQGQYPESEADYRKALELEPDSASAQIGLAFVLLENQQLPEAHKLLQRLAGTQPSNFFIHYLLGELHIRQDAKEDAIRELEKAASLEPRFAAVHTDLGKLYLKQSDVTRAVRELEASLRLDPDDTTAYYQLATAYRKAGQPDKAKEALAAVRRLNEERSALGSAKFLTQRFRKARDRALAPF